jgi:hypothetical protein
MSKSVNIFGRFSPVSAELIGAPESLIKLAETLSNDIPSVIYALANPVDLSLLPSENFLTTLQIIQEESMVKITVEQDSLIIKGKKEKLSTLAQNIRFHADLAKSTGENNHIHIEYFPDHFYLDPSSFPLIVTVEASI